MKYVQHSIRLPTAQDRALKQTAKDRQISPYALLQQYVRAGMVALSDAPNQPQANAEMAQEIGAISARTVHIERLIERAVYVACASYTFARAAAGSQADDAKLTQEINAAFLRQLKLAGEQ